MKKIVLLLSALAGGLVPCLAGPPAGAQALTINNGSTLTIKGGTLDVNCLDILVKDGGSLLLQSGRIRDKKSLTVEPAGTFANTGGRIIQCGACTLYAIRAPSGKVVVIPFEIK